MEDDQTDPEMVLLVLMERAFKGPTHEGVRILDWAPQLKRVLKCVRENDPMTMELRGEIERLRAELEASETELRIVRASQAESNAEVERLRAELAECRQDNERLHVAMCQSCVCLNNGETYRGHQIIRAALATGKDSLPVDPAATAHAELAECKRDAERYRTALEQIVAPFEDLNFVSGNKLLTYIHDTATAALAAKGG